MSAIRLLSHRDFMDEQFPFKMEFRSLKEYTRVVHAHDHFQLCYVSAGSCFHRIKGKQVVLVKGDFFSIPPFLEHQVAPRETMDFEIVQIDFLPNFINENMQDLSRLNHFFDFAYIQPLLSIQEELLPKLNFSPAGQRLTESIIDDMRRELKDQEEGYRLVIRAELLKLLVIAGREFRNYYRGDREKKLISQHRKAFYDAIAFIDEHYQEDIRLEDIAKKSHMAPTYFSGLFKLLKGMNFTEYINDVRISRAIELLKETDYSIMEVCFQVGYNNVGHFNKMFKKITLVTPSEYRTQATRKARGENTH